MSSLAYKFKRYICINESDKMYQKGEWIVFWVLHSTLSLTDVAVISRVYLSKCDLGQIEPNDTDNADKYV